MVKKHHGEINLTSVPGDTKFMVWLPFTAQNEGDETPQPAPQEQETTS